MRKKKLCTPSPATAPSPLQEHMHTYIEAQGHLLPILAPGPFRQCALSPTGYHHLTESKQMLHSLLGSGDGWKDDAISSLIS